jgi:hypothetical protein
MEAAKMGKTRRSKEFEILVKKIQAQLTPDAQVEHDVKIKGKISRKLRQIDCLVRQNIGQYEIVIAIECRDKKKPVDVNAVGAFQKVLEDIGANKGAMVCPAGFTDGAKNVAKHHEIDLFSPIDTDPHKWQARVLLPLICDFRAGGMSLGFRGAFRNPFKMENDFFSTVSIEDDEGNKLGTPVEIASRRWNNGEFPAEPGQYTDINIFDHEHVYFDDGFGGRVRATFFLNLLVEQHLFLGRLPVTQFSGFLDQRTGEIITNAFTTGILDPDEVFNTWRPITVDQLPSKPTLRVRGLAAWPQEELAAATQFTI